jgi:hypothetical protein
VAARFEKERDEALQRAEREGLHRRTMQSELEAMRAAYRGYTGGGGGGFLTRDMRPA